MIEDLYWTMCGTPSDISPHLPALRALADECSVVVEFGVRFGFSTAAFLASRCRRVVSYDINPAQFTPPPDVVDRWEFIRIDTAALRAGDIPACDLLFVDSLHTGEQVRQELRQAGRVSRYLAFHDTQTFGSWDEGPVMDGNPVGGVVTPILQFLAGHPEWRVKSHTPICNGLTVLERTNK